MTKFSKLFILFWRPIKFQWWFSTAWAFHLRWAVYSMFPSRWENSGVTLDFFFLEYWLVYSPKKIKNDLIHLIAYLDSGPPSLKKNIYISLQKKKKIYIYIYIFRISGNGTSCVGWLGCYIYIHTLIWIIQKLKKKY